MNKKNMSSIIIIMLVGVSCMPSTYGTIVQNECTQQEKTSLPEIPFDASCEVHCVIYDGSDSSWNSIKLSAEDATCLYNQLQNLQSDFAFYPTDEHTLQEMHTLVNMLLDNKIVTSTVKAEDVLDVLHPTWADSIPQAEKSSDNADTTPLLGNRATSIFCSIASVGSGWVLPPVLIPRPRLMALWRGGSLFGEAYTYFGNMLTYTGYLAVGPQVGVTLGFTGIGLTFATPIGPVYGLIGYSLLTTVTANSIYSFPPNYSPDIQAINPSSDAVDVPTALSELTFRLEDSEGDLMSYSVVTTPDIGSDTGSNKPNGIYTVDISGLDSKTVYTWTVEASDGNTWTSKTFSFTTETAEPIVSDIIPADDARHVHLPLSELVFTLHDNQGDPMDYTVETVPDIGSFSGTGVENGEYSVAVSDVAYATQYTWFVNVTDGEYWTNEQYTFTTEEPPFNPFDEGWMYRKQITIDHDLVANTLIHFPIRVSTVDADVMMHAQPDGDDILFMEQDGISRRFFHELEWYDNTAGHIEAWVNIPELSASSDTVLYMYYGNPSCENQQHTIDVWDDHYVALWHMGDIEDTTTNNYDLVNNGATEFDNGRIGGCYEFITTEADYMYQDTLFDQHPEEFTLETWSYAYQDNYEKAILSKRNDDYNRWRFRIMEDDLVNLFHVGGSGKKWSYSTGPVHDNYWVYLVATYKANTFTGIYINTTYSTGLVPGDIGDGSDYDFFVGLSPGEFHHTFDGLLDEIRISDVVRSSQWLETTYNTIANPTDFLSFGTEEPAP